MSKGISDNDWGKFEELVFQILLNLFHLTPDGQSQLTKSKKDGGFDGIFYFPADLTGDEDPFCAIMEAKLRTNLKRDIPLQDFSKSMIIAINRAARLLIVASNLRLSEKTVCLLKDYSQKTGLEIRYLSVDVIYKQLGQNPELKQLCPTSLLNLLERSNKAFLQACGNSMAKSEELKVTEELPIIREPIELFSAERRKQCEEIVHIFKQTGGAITVEGNAGIGKSFFLSEVQRRLGGDGFGVIKVDLKNCNTSRVLFVELVKAFWCIPEALLDSIGKKDFSQAITWIGNGFLDSSIQKAVVIAFQKSKYNYIKHSDLFHYYLIEYLLQLYAQVKKRKKYIICFTNLNYTQADLLDFLLHFIKRFDTDIRILLEIRTSVYIDGKMPEDQWEGFVTQFFQLSCLQYRCKLRILEFQEYCTYINSLLEEPRLSIRETSLILEKAGYTLLLINAFITYLKSCGFQALPRYLWVSNIVAMPVDHGQQIIPMLVDVLSGKGSRYSGLFFLTYLFQGRISCALAEQFLGPVEDVVDDLLSHTDIYALCQDHLQVSHALYLDYFATRQYLSLAYQQELAGRLLAAAGSATLFSSYEEETVCRIRLYDILGDIEQVAILSLNFGIAMRQYGQYSLSQTYIKMAQETLARLVCRELRPWVCRHIEALLTLLENELYLQKLDRSELQSKLSVLEESFEKLTAADLERQKVRNLCIRFHLIGMRLYHYWGDYRTSMVKVKRAVSELREDTPAELAGRVWLEYGIATKETDSLAKCLQVFRQGRKRCPGDAGLLFSNLTHLSEKYSTVNAAIAMRCLELIEPLKTQLPLSSRLHHEINLATMRMYCGDYDRAQEDGAAIIRRADQAGLKNEEARCSNLLGCLAYIQGDYSEAARNLNHGDMLIPEAKHVTVLWPILVNLLSVQVSMGQYEFALKTAHRCGRLLQGSYIDRVKHFKIAPAKYPKLFIGLLLTLRAYLTIGSSTQYAETCTDQINTLLSTFRLIELNENYGRMEQGESLERILQNTPFYQAGKIVIKS